MRISKKQYSKNKKKKRIIVLIYLNSIVNHNNRQGRFIQEYKYFFNQKSTPKVLILTCFLLVKI